MVRSINLQGSPNILATLIDKCPRCQSNKITFDIFGKNEVPLQFGTADWQLNYEVFSKCRHCLKATIFVVYLTNYNAFSAVQRNDYWSNRNINADFTIASYISAKDHTKILPPDFLPFYVENAFKEGAACMGVLAFNAAAAMFRLSVDLATKGYLPAVEQEGGPNRKQRRELAARLEWLFDNSMIPGDLKELALSVREDGNEGVHDGTLTKHDAEDLADFATALLTRIYTEPARIESAKQRRINRRESKEASS